LGREVKRVALDFNWPLWQPWSGYTRPKDQRQEPPAGAGWQLWETVSEGSPASPVFGTAEELAGWMSSLPSDDLSYAPYDSALAWVTGDGWGPSLVVSHRGIETGVRWLGRTGTNGPGDA
jgi:hypothetical protein